MDPFTILIATKNKHKAEELAALTTGLAGSVSLSEWEEQRGQKLTEPEETGDSFLKNALIKAQTYAAATGLVTLADDSGLTVPALNGEPGVKSARYGRPGFDDVQRCRFLLAKMKGKHDRRAYFSTVLALAKPDGSYLYWRGRLYGFITRSMRGSNGFGYDPIFYSPAAGQGRTLAQLPAEEKNAISHRAEAVKGFLKDLEAIREFLKP